MGVEITKEILPNYRDAGFHIQYNETAYGCGYGARVESEVLEARLWAIVEGLFGLLQGESHGYIRERKQRLTIADVREGFDIQIPSIWDLTIDSSDYEVTLSASLPTPNCSSTASKIDLKVSNGKALTYTDPLARRVYAFFNQVETSTGIDSALIN
tara:strand:- start:990 stop:1457 length:468 start_codon:yes stop_codon:yes gene_type:complete